MRIPRRRSLVGVLVRFGRGGGREDIENMKLV